MAEAARIVDADDDRLRADLGVHVAGRAGGLVDLLPLPVGPHRRLPHPRPRLVHLRLGPHPHRPGMYAVHTVNYVIVREFLRVDILSSKTDWALQYILDE